jgi:putative transposase
MLAKAQRKVRRQRDDLAHRMSNKLARQCGTMALEGLNIISMVKGRPPASAIMGPCWGKLRWFTVYKAEGRGGRIIFVNPARTSQKCPRCGGMVPRPLSERIHIRPKCGLILDRDVNAARNILALGLERALTEAEPPLIHHRMSGFGRGSEKPTSFRRG